MSFDLNGLSEVRALNFGRRYHAYDTTDTLSAVLADGYFDAGWYRLGARDRLDIEFVRIGSAGAKAMAVVRGDADAYIHAGGQWEWDSAAPAGVLQAAGLHATRLDGSPLRYNRPDPYLPDLLMCRPDVADLLLDAMWLAS